MMTVLPSEQLNKEQQSQKKVEKTSFLRTAGLETKKGEDFLLDLSQFDR